MPYVNSNGTVIDQRSKFRLSFITDMIWFVVDIFSIFFNTLFYPNQKVKSRKRDTLTPFRKKGANIHVTCPKPGKTHQQGLEHAEVVIGSPKDGIYKSKRMLQAFTRQYPDVQFDEKAIDKEANADVSISLLQGMSVKFHARPVYEVIAEEVQEGHVEPIPEDYFTSRLNPTTLPPLPSPSSSLSTSTSSVRLPSHLAGSIVTMRFPPPPESDKDISALLSDPVAMEHLAAMAKQRSGGWSEEEAAARRVRQAHEHVSGSSLNGAVYLLSAAAAAGGQEGAMFAGIGGFRSIDWWSRSAEMGVILAPSYWRRGLSVDVHHLCLTVAFEQLCLNRIEFKTASTNMAMRQFLIEILGATHEGTLRDAFPLYDTTDAFKLYANVEMYSVLACEWPTLKKSLQEKIQSRT